MLGKILESLHSELLSKAFLISHLLPTTLFFFVGALTLSSQHVESKQMLLQLWKSENPVESLLSAGVLSLLLIVAGYLFSMLNTPLRELMEGLHWGEKLLKDFKKNLIIRQTKRLAELEKRLQKEEHDRHRIALWRSRWENDLAQARQEGSKKSGFVDRNKPRASERVEELRQKRWAREAISYNSLEKSVSELKDALSRNKIDPRPKNKKKKGFADQLDQDQTDLYDIIDYAEDRLLIEIQRRYSEKEFNFPNESLAPTRMGNITQAIRSYSISRYGMDLEMFWTRLQKVMQSDAGFYSVIQEAKIKLDFAVSLFWLATTFLVIWLPLLVIYTYGLAAYLMVAVIGTAVVLGSYRLAIQNNKAFANLMRTAIDLYRLELLKTLKISLPSGSLEERRLWDVLNRHFAYGERFNFDYERQEP